MNVIDLNEKRQLLEATPEPTFEITQVLMDLVTIVGMLIVSPPPRPTPAQLDAAMQRLRELAAQLGEMDLK
jgi:hypothetical protein